MDANLKEIFLSVGSLSNLHTKNKKNLVEAINELSSVINSPRHLVGYIDFVSTVDEFDNRYLQDKNIVYTTFNNKWWYYSEALNEYIPLPKDWQKLDVIVRNITELNELETKSNGTYGILETGEVYRQSDNALYKTNCPATDVGDEYIVRTLILEDQSVHHGSIVYTPKGWMYLVD